MIARLMNIPAPEAPERIGVPQHLRAQLAPVAQRVFWWGHPAEWLDDAIRFVAQVMTYGDWSDTCTTLRLLGDPLFQEVLAHAPPGVFDRKSWSFWHHYYHLGVPSLPTRKL